MTLDKILQPIVVAAVIGMATFSWRTEARLQRIEYALGIDEVIPGKRVAHHGLDH